MAGTLSDRFGWLSSSVPEPGALKDGLASWADRYPGTIFLVAAVSLVYLFELVLAGVDGDVHRVLFEGMPTDTVQDWFKYGRDHPKRWFTIVSSILAHGHWFWHFLGNTVLLVVFGPAVERRLGRGWHIGFFAILGLLTNLAQARVGPATMWGASGVIFAYGAYWPIAGYRKNFATTLEFTPANVRNWAVRTLVFLTFFVTAFGFVVQGPTPGSSAVAHASGWILGALLGAVCR